MDGTLRGLFDDFYGRRVDDEVESQAVRLSGRIHTRFGTGNEPKRLDAVARDHDVDRLFDGVLARALEVRQVEFRSRTLAVYI